MDIRKIQATGGSSYIVTLPKDWITENGLKKNDPVRMSKCSDGGLTIFPASRMKDPSVNVKIIDVDSVSSTTLLFRMLLGAYISGHGQIEVRSSSRLDSGMVDAATRFIDMAIGVEIVEESSDRIVMKDLVDPGEMRFPRTVERMKVLVRNMLSDVMDSLEMNDPSKVENIEARDREVDRIEWFISRQTNMTVRDTSIIRKIGVEPLDIYRNYTVSRALERIGDHAVLMAKYSSLLTGMDDLKSVRLSIARMGRQVTDLFLSSVGAWTKVNLAEANKIIEEASKLVKECNDQNKSIVGLSKEVTMTVNMLIGSLSRISEYSADISELAINAAMSR